jgi:acyl-CoA synthetase (AMP-forming)/AMP-acid ligase II
MLGAMQYWPLRVMRLIDHAEREHGPREIVSRYASGETVRTNWAGVARDARRLAAALERLGIGRGDRVATLAMNHSRHLVAWYGTIGMGGIIHTVNPRLFAEQLVYIFNHAEDRMLLYDAAFQPLVDALRPQLKTVEHYVCFDPPSPDRHPGLDPGSTFSSGSKEGGSRLKAGMTGLGSFEGLIAQETGEYRWVEGDEREPCMLCYTSGTTGNPKGVLYEHRSTVLHAMAEVSADCLDLSARAVALPIVPMFHAAAWGLPFAAATVGCKLVFSADYTPSVMCDLLRDERVTHSAGVPTVWLGMMQYVEASGRDLGDLKVVTIGGSAAPRAMIRFFMDRGIRVGHAWGMTEMSPIGTIGAPPAGWDDFGPDQQLDYIARQGRVPFGVELRVVDDEGRVLPRDGKSSGRLQARGPWIIHTYFKDETGPAVDADGWFNTGDVSVLHPDGTMQITDRAKDVIKSGGEWISSIELENAAVGCPGVAEAAAGGPQGGRRRDRAGHPGAPLRPRREMVVAG